MVRPVNVHISFYIYMIIKGNTVHKTSKTNIKTYKTEMRSVNGNFLQADRIVSVIVSFSRVQITSCPPSQEYQVTNRIS